MNTRMSNDNNNSSSKLKYSKLKMMKSRSVDLSDLAIWFPKTPKTVKPRELQTSEKEKGADNTDDLMKKDQQLLDTIADPHRQPMAVRSKGLAGPVLRRNGSVSSSLKTRALSMRRSSSVNSERYCRIYDQSLTLGSPIDDDNNNINIIIDENEQEEEGDYEDIEKSSAKKKKQIKGGGKILKVCKRFFGL